MSVLDDVITKRDIKSETIIKRQKPKQYAVMLLNNNVTAFEAVVDVLATVFNLNIQKATIIMQQAHRTGKSQCFSGVKEICDSKVNEARDYCLKKQHEMHEYMPNRPMYYERLEFIVEEMDKGE